MGAAQPAPSTTPLCAAPRARQHTAQGGDDLGGASPLPLVEEPHLLEHESAEDDALPIRGALQRELGHDMVVTDPSLRQTEQVPPHWLDRSARNGEKRREELARCHEEDVDEGAARGGLVVGEAVVRAAGANPTRIADTNDSVGARAVRCLGAASLVERLLPECATVLNVIDDAPELAMRFVTTGGPEREV